MQPCEDRIPALVDFAAGELGGAERVQLERHLDACPACRAEVALMRGVETSLREANPPIDDLALASFPYRTTDRAEQFRDRSLRGMWWSLQRGARFALGLSGATLALSLVLFASTRAPAPVAQRAPATESAQVADGTSTTAEEGFDLLGTSEIHPLTASTDSSTQGAISDDAYDTATLDQTLDSLSLEELDQLAMMLGQSPS